MGIVNLGTQAFDEIKEMGPGSLTAAINILRNPPANWNNEETTTFVRLVLAQLLEGQQR